MSDERRERRQERLGVNSVAWSPDGRQLATGSGDYKARIWDKTAGELVHVLKGHRYFVSSVAWSPDGRQVATGCDDRKTRIWDATTGEVVRELDPYEGKWFRFCPVNSVAWSPDGRQVATGSQDGKTRIWDANTGEVVRELEFIRTAGCLSCALCPINSVAWSPDGRQVATGSSDSTARIWDATTGYLVRTLEIKMISCGCVHFINDVRSVAWSPDGRQLATGTMDKARIWDATTGEVVRELEFIRTACFCCHVVSHVKSVAWSPDGRQVATGSSDNTARIWDATTGEVVRELEEPERCCCW